MKKDIFKNAGLTDLQAEIFEFLLLNKNSKASDIAKKINKSRGMVYLGLDELINLGLAGKKNKKSGVATFSAEHPGKLEKIFIEREKKLQREKRALIDNLPEIISDYNLTNNRPGVRFFEGEKGLIHVLNDTLKSKSEIYTYSDISEFDEAEHRINSEYIKKRVKAKINKKIITPDANKKFDIQKQDFTQVKYINKELMPTSVAMQIYGGKISYQAFNKGNRMAVIIEDKNIYKMHKQFFDFFWNILQ